MKFKLRQKPVEYTADGQLICADETTTFILSGVIRMASEGPEMGDPILNAIISVYGAKYITDVEYDTSDEFMAY